MQTDWSKYAKCTVCFSLAGTSCRKITNEVMEKPHPGRRKKTDWSQYGYCETCDRTAGAPCRDTRYGRRSGEHFNREWPHSKRAKVGS